jgi:hypothetical protein
MPRQIIDTESGRPAYVRRRALQAAIVVGVLLALVIAAFVVLRHNQVPGGRSSFQETQRVSAEPRSPSHLRRIHAA